MKLATSDATAILHLFGEGDEALQPRLIDQLHVSHPTQHTTLAAFRYGKQSYVIVADPTAEGNTDSLIYFVLAKKPNSTGSFLPVPGEQHDALSYKGKVVYLFKITRDKKRLDLFLSEAHPETSRSTWQKYIKAGYVRVNNRLAGSTRQEVSDADSVTTSIPDPTDHSQHVLPIIYIDNNVIVIDKPAGVLTHSKGALNDEFTVADFFRRYTTYNLDTNRPGIIHRLDRDTSGVLIGARNPETAQLLQRQFADRKVKKTYIAILDGTLKQKEAEIQLPIGRNPSVPSTFRVDSKGKAATTRYKVMAEKTNKTLVELQPLTGRTHQLRVHMHYLHAPIYGDRIYGKAANRLYLHAWKLEATIPKGDRQVFESPLPREFDKLLTEVVQ